jgi:hypothetical protein
VTGLKYFEKLVPMLARLHTVGCERGKAGNRDLHYDELCLLLLLGLFNPVVDGLRGIQQASALVRSIQFWQTAQAKVRTTPMSTCSSGRDAPTSIMRPETKRPGVPCGRPCIPGTLKQFYEACFPANTPCLTVSTRHSS